LKAQENDIAFAIADGGPGVGLVRKPTKESDWRDVPLIDSVRGAFERQLARRRELTGQEPWPGEYIFASDPDGAKPIRPDSLSDRLAEARGDSNVTLQDLRHYVATTMPACRTGPLQTCSATARSRCGSTTTVVPTPESATP